MGARMRVIAPNVLLGSMSGSSSGMSEDPWRRGAALFEDQRSLKGKTCRSRAGHVNLDPEATGLLTACKRSDVLKEASLRASTAAVSFLRSRSTGARCTAHRCGRVRVRWRAPGPFPGAHAASQRAPGHGSRCLPGDSDGSSPMIGRSSSLNNAFSTRLITSWSTGTRSSFVSASESSIVSLAGMYSARVTRTAPARSGSLNMFDGARCISAQRCQAGPRFRSRTGPEACRAHGQWQERPK